MAKEKKPEGMESLKERLARLNKTYGVGAVMSLDDKGKKEYDVISTGSVGFDYGVLGVGGFVKGKLYEMIGWESTGKTTICGHLSANCQKAGGKAVYIDGEHAVDKKYFENLGINIKELIFSQPSSGEEGFQIALELIESGEIDLVIIDSDSSLMPLKVVQGEIGESAIGLKARLNGSAYPKLKTALVKNNVCVVVISQYREKIGVMFGDPRTTQGGHALKFYSDCRIEVSKTLTKDGTKVIGNDTKVKTIKNKTYSPFNETRFDIKFGVGIDVKKEIIELAHESGIGKKYGKSFTWEDVKMTREEFEKLLDDKDFLNNVIDTLKTVLVKKDGEHETE